MDRKPIIKPRTIAELLPGLTGIVSKDSIQTLTVKKESCQTIVNSCTAEKIIKPLTIAEMRADISSLRIQSPKRRAVTTSKKNNWNSSVKIVKTVSQTANGKIKHNPAVRKMLNFQPKPKPISNFRATMAPESQKFPRPESRAKKSLFLLQAPTNVRISGINNIAESPVVNKHTNSQMTLANKENVSNQTGIKKISLPKLLTTKSVIPNIRVRPNTTMSNESWKSSCDNSFLLKEEEINDTEEKTKAIAPAPTLENIAANTPPVAAPLEEYRNVPEYFNNSSELESSATYHDNTIMTFEKPAEIKHNTNREERAIASLCDILEKRTEHSLKIIDSSITAFNEIKQSQLTTLHYVRKLINDKKPCERGDNTKETPKVIQTEKFSPERQADVSKPCSVIKSCLKSPSYKIPKKNLCLRKKVGCKSMLNVSNEPITPVKVDMGNKALSMYMKMKEHMNFLSTPAAKPEFHVPDTPAVTSRNLQKQLDKLYDEN